MEYNPHHWAVVRVTATETGKVHYRVAASWDGSYTYGASWKMNSGIESYIEEDGYITFMGTSGSTYVCGAFAEGANGYLSSIIQSYNVNPEIIKVDVINFETFKQEFLTTVKGNDEHQTNQ